MHNIDIDSRIKQSSVAFNNQGCCYLGLYLQAISAVEKVA